MLYELEQFYHKLPIEKVEKIHWQNLHGCATALAITCVATTNPLNPLLIITPNILATAKLEQELRFFFGKTEDKEHEIPILVLPDWETLPYDHFSPHEDIISQRLFTLSQMQFFKSGIILVAATTLMHRLPPENYIMANSFVLKTGENIDLNQFRNRLENQSYTCTSKVMAHGEFAVRGSIIDIFPIGSKTPFRIDLLDTKVDSIRIFNPDTQRSSNKINKIQVLPAKEHPLTNEAVSKFRQSWRSRFNGDPLRCAIYQSIVNHENYPGIEYYLPLFFEETATLFNYLPPNPIIIKIGNNEEVVTNFWQEINERYEQLRHDQTRPLLAPTDLYIPVDQIFGMQNAFPQILINPEKYKENIKPNKNSIYFNTGITPDVFINNKEKSPLIKLQDFIKNHINARILFIAESAGRREVLIDLLQTINLNPTVIESWQEFLLKNPAIYITVAPIEQAAHLISENKQAETLIITETQIFGEQATQYRSNKTRIQSPENIIRDLTELQIGSPVVHFDHGIGRYLGLQKLIINNYETEFLILEYADNSKLYVPVTSINLISRYTGATAENAPIDNLGSKQWEKTKREAQAKIHDAAVEILEIHARRLKELGFAFSKPNTDYERFAATFPFIETQDQKRAIDEVITDMTSERPMDRLICGDVGFGKTEVAMRAVFIAINSGKQVILLTPTTLLARQHFVNFHDRFVDWPFNISLFSRFNSTKEQKTVLENLYNGKIDLVIGTHKLLQKNVKFKNLGLLIIDEEHRFGVKQKEYIKQLAPHIDILALTATPIPRTLNMAFASIRDFSIISTPPARRLAIKTFVHERNKYLIKEAIVREILRGGQVYFLHNDITTIEKISHELQQLIPNARIAVAHGQMRKQELEQVMGDFYHLRINILICTTIIESGLDIPTANTIIIDRADRFGLAQLHQLRGRVGRSHHQAYAYLITPPFSALTQDAKKRLDAITSMEDLGAGFILATHDLEIRGAGELLGEEQSGAMQNIGFSLYMEMLEQAVLTLKAGKEAEIENQTKANIEIELQIPALIPDKYIEDMNLRLVLYKRIASIKNKDELNELQIEIIDRFGKLPEFTKNLFKITELKLKARKIDIIKITIGANNKGNIEFSAKPNINPDIIFKLLQKHPNICKLKGPNQIEFQIESQNNAKIDFINNLLDKLAG